MSSPVATASRRKSGRAVRIPEKFAPETRPVTAKRKRSGNDVENNASDVEEEEEELASDATSTLESADEEEVRGTRKKAKPIPKASSKPVAKKPKVNGTVSHEEDASAVRLPSRPKKGKKVAIADRSAEGLYGERIRTC